MERKTKLREERNIILVQMIIFQFIFKVYRKFLFCLEMPIYDVYRKGYILSSYKKFGVFEL